VQGSGKDGAVSAGTVPHVRIGVSWIQRQIAKSHFLAEKIRGLWLNLIEEKDAI
jgi:hypothetical protein